MTEQILKEILNEIKSMKAEISSIRQEMATKEDIAKLDAKIDKLATEGQKDVIAMLQHVQEETKAIPRIEAKLDVLAHRLFEQEAEINLIKKKAQ